MINFAKPKAGEYAPYAVVYVDLIPDDGQILQHLQNSLKSARQMTASMTDVKLTTPFAEGEWTVKEILSHIMDSERVFCYRALRFARNDLVELFPVDQDLYVKNSGVNERSIEDILEEYGSIRQASLTLFNSFSLEALLRTGLVNGNPTTVRGIVWLTAGHEAHHLNSIRQNYL